MEIRAKGAKAKLKPAAPDTAEPGRLQPDDGLELSTFREFRNQAVEQAEKDYMLRLLRKCEGDIASAISISGLGRTRLYNLLKKHGLSFKRLSG